MKYCIGCRHLYFEPGSRARNYSERTFENDEPAELSCRNGHWRAQLSDGFTQEKFEKAMESAEKCADYSDRHAHEVSEQT